MIALSVKVPPGVTAAGELAKRAIEKSVELSEKLGGIDLMFILFLCVCDFSADEAEKVAVRM
ncbi:hypothetical protein N9920_03865 [Akkermansiaceae bacterium]|nr:hypothetical protein [Akkermansiaceae bacterium]